MVAINLEYYDSSWVTRVEINCVATVAGGNSDYTSGQLHRRPYCDSPGRPVCVECIDRVDGDIGIVADLRDVNGHSGAYSEIF